MPEEAPKNNNKKEEKPEITPEEMERLENWFEMHPETVNEYREAGPEIAKFEAMVANFKEEYDLEALHAIHELSVKDSRSHPIREPARLAIIPIISLLTVLKKETNITEEKYKELEDSYNVLNRAVGHIKNDILYHDR